MTAPAMTPTVTPRRTLRAWAEAAAQRTMSAAPAWPTKPILSSKPNLSFVCLLIYLFIVHSGRLPIAQVVLSVGLLLLPAMGGRIRIPVPLLWFGGLVLWAYVTASLSPFPEVSFPACLDLFKVWLIAVLAVNAIRTRDELRLFIVVWLGLFAVFPVRGTMMNYLAGINEFGRYFWNFVFSNPNDLASFCVLQLALCVALLQVEKRPWLRMSALIGILLVSLVILLTQSRGGMLALGTFAVFALARQKKRMRTILFAGLAGLVVVAAAPDKALGRLKGLTALLGGVQNVKEVDKEQSAASRYNIWRVAMAAFRDRPVVGFGWGAYKETHLMYSVRVRGVPLTAKGPRDAHSTFVKALAETGVVGLAVFLGIVVSSRRSVLRTARSLEESQPEISRFLRLLLIGQLAYLQSAIFGSYAHLPFFYLFTVVMLVTARLYGAEGAPKAVAQPAHVGLLRRTRGNRAAAVATS